MRRIKGVFKYLAAVGLLAVAGCREQKGMSDDVISQNDVYTVTTDSVVQGKWVAVAKSPLHIESNYRSPRETDVSSLLEFRLSLNSRDNELLVGKAHYAIVGIDTTVTFGVPQAKPSETPKPLANNVQWTLRVDISEILESFDSKGFYTTPTGDVVYKEDFRGIGIAGNIAPLNWDYENPRYLNATGEPGIYAITLTMNPAIEADDASHSWQIEAENPDFPQFSSPYTLVDALYNMAIADIVRCQRPDGTYRAGVQWDGVWTRDVSYSIYLALAYLDPDRAIESLKAKVKNDRIIQDTGTGGSWPVSTDRIVWIMAAWEIYKVTGSEEWLRYAYNVARNSIEDDRLVALDRATGLMHGEQSYLDWRSQSYPRWMQPKDIYESMCLGTNVAFAQAFFALDEMAEILGVDSDYKEQGKRIKDAINQNLWQEDKGYYSAYLYGGVTPVKSPSLDNLGQALSVIFDVADDDRAETLVESTPITTFGTPSIYPRRTEVTPYHNDAVWPFVQAYWNIAAARVGNENVLRRGLGAMYRAAALFGTHKELFVASTGDYSGTPVNSDAQLWSCTGNVAMIFRVFAGMEFKTGGIEFNPFIPACFPETMSIKGFRYRNAVLNVEIEGSGNEIAEIEIDGRHTDDNFFPASLQGEHTIVITMKQGRKYSQKATVTTIEDMPDTPVAAHLEGTDSVLNPAAGMKYLRVVNGSADMLPSASALISHPGGNFASMGIVAQGAKYASFMSRPLDIIADDAMKTYQCEDFATPGTSLIEGTRSKQFVEISTSKNTDISIPVVVPAAGTYYVDVRYANGNGPINTDNRCAVRMLFVNTHLQGALVMPQRGSGEWLNTGFSNRLAVELLGGKNVFQIMYVEPYCINMNGTENTALIDYIRLIKK